MSKQASEGVVRMRVIKNSRGITLIELLASVVLLAILVVPITSIGTTTYKWYKQDQMENGAILAAEQVMEAAKQQVELGSAPTGQQTVGSYAATVTTQANYQNIADMTKITVTVSYTDPTNQANRVHTYSTAVRKRGTP